jgi:hypothetical protein
MKFWRLCSFRAIVKAIVLQEPFHNLASRGMHEKGVRSGLKPTDFDSLHNISAGKHFYQFYKGPEDYLHAMVSYFQTGLEKGQACFWLVSARIGIPKVHEFVESLIPQAKSYLSTGQLQILSAETWYLTQGTFDEEKAMSNALQALETIQKKGFSVLRGSGDAGAIPRSDWKRVFSYEKNISRWIKSQPVIALCAYPIFECSLTETQAVLDRHDDVLIGRF